MTWKRSGVAESQLLDVSKLLRNRPVIDTDPRIMHTRVEQPINQSEFQHQRGINLFRKLHPPTAAAGILMLLVRVDKCAKYAAQHEIGDRSWSKHKGRDTKSRAEPCRCQRGCAAISTTGRKYAWQSQIQSQEENHVLSSGFHQCGDGTEKAQNTGVKNASGIQSCVPQKRCKSQFQNISAVSTTDTKQNQT